MNDVRTDSQRGWLGLPPAVAVALTAVAVALTAAGRAITAWETDKYDPYFFAHVAARWVHGAVPYIEIWDNKPPGIYALGRLVFTFFPGSFPALAAVEVLFVLAAIWAVAATLHRVKAPAEAIAAGVLAASLAMNLKKYGQGGFTTELYMMFPAALGMLWFLDSDRGRRLLPLVGAGVLSGVATLFKTVGLTTMLARMAVLGFWVLTRRISVRRAVMAALADAVGVVIAWVPAMLYFRAHDALNLMFQATFFHNAGYAASSWKASPLYVLMHTFGALQQIAPLAACVPVVAVAAWWSKPVREWQRESLLGDLVLLLFVWVAAEAGGVLAGGKGFEHYYLTMMPCLALCCALAVWFLVPDHPPRTALRVGIGALVLLPFLVPLSQDLYDAYIAARLRSNYGAWTPEVKIATYLNANRRPGDTLFMWDYKPLVYFRTGMTSTSRLLFGDRTNFSPYDIRYVNEISGDLSAHPPTYFVFSTSARHTDSPLVAVLNRQIDSEYEPALEAGDFVLYRRRASAVPPLAEEPKRP